MSVQPLTNDPEALSRRLMEGDERALARALRLIDDRRPEAREILKRIYPNTGSRFLLGVTGAPGAGKSTLTDQLIAHYRSQNLTVGVLAIDPSSPFTGGAILGDRIRMIRHAGDPGVFIRSLATRGAMGGISRSTADSVKALEAAGRDIIIIETVGVGQDEVDIVKLADTTLVVLAPGGGDDIQAIKAGILEIADLFVVNKADRDGADRTVQDLEQMLALKTDMSVEMWMPKVMKTIAASAKGVAELGAAIEEHRRWCESTGERQRKLRTRIASEFTELLSHSLSERITSRLREAGRLEPLIETLSNRRSDPYSEVEKLLGEYMK